MATYYVDDATGDDADTGLTEALAFKTIQKAASTIATSDVVYIKNTNTYKETVTLAFVNGTAAANVIWEGYSTTPGDDGVVTIDGESTRTDGWVGSGLTHHIWRNIKVINHTDNGWDLSTANIMSFERCEATDNGDRGIFMDNYCKCVDCHFEGNGVAGVWNDQYGSFINCTFYDNGTTATTTYQLYSSQYFTTIVNCVFSGASSDYLVRVGTGMTIINCTFDGKGSSHGVYASSSYYPSTIMNCIFHDCSTAILMPAAAYLYQQMGFNNLMNNNTTDYTNWLPTDDDLSGTPDFTDEANNDYTLTSTSAAIGAGRDLAGDNLGKDCGAYQTEPSGGGGGRVVYAG